MEYLEKKEIPLTLIRYKEINDSYYGKSFLFTLKKDRKKLFIKYNINLEDEYEQQLFIKEILIIYKKINKKFFLLPKFLSKTKKVISFYIEYFLDNNLSQKILKKKAKISLFKLKFLEKLEKFYKEMLKELHKNNLVYFFLNLENILEFEKNFKIKWFPFFFEKKFNFSDKLILSPRLVSKIKEKNNFLKNFENDFFFQDDFDSLYFLILKLLDLSGFNNFYKIKKNEISINIEYINSLEELNSTLKEKSFFHTKTESKNTKIKNWNYLKSKKKKTFKISFKKNPKKLIENIIQDFPKIFPQKNNEKNNLLNIYKKKGLYNGEDYRYKKNYIGTIDFFNGDFFLGNFKEKKINGKGLYIYKNGDIYNGEFFNNFLDGYGEYFFYNENIYKGFWKKNRQNENGIFFDKKLNLIFKGFWRNGKKEGEFVIFDILKKIFFKVFFKDAEIEKFLGLVVDDKGIRGFLRDLKNKEFFFNLYSSVIEDLRWNRDEDVEFRKDFCFVRNIEDFSIY